jgi:hypothetical protein
MDVLALAFDALAALSALNKDRNWHGRHADAM